MPSREQDIAKLLRWFAGLPLTMVATQCLLVGLVLSATEAAGWNDWGMRACWRRSYPSLDGRSTEVAHVASNRKAISRPILAAQVR